MDHKAAFKRSGDLLRSQGDQSFVVLRCFLAQLCQSKYPNLWQCHVIKRLSQYSFPLRWRVDVQEDGHSVPLASPTEKQGTARINTEMRATSSAGGTSLVGK